MTPQQKHTRGIRGLMVAIVAATALLVFFEWTTPTAPPVNYSPAGQCVVYVVH